MKATSYLRVSTAGQGRSGLGIEAQRIAVDAFVAQRGWNLAQEFVEVESGKRSDRPELAKALHQAKMTGATLVIAKLDRLSRNAAFLLTLRDSGVRFLAADIPDANDLTIGVLAVIAQAERDAISKRTRDALQAIKGRLAKAGHHTSVRSGRTIGRLGNPNGAAVLKKSPDANKAATAQLVSKADQRATDLKPILEALHAEGAQSYPQLAARLNAQGVLTARGGAWYPATVRNVLQRLKL